MMMKSGIRITSFLLVVILTVHCLGACRRASTSGDSLVNVDKPVIENHPLNTLGMDNGYDIVAQNNEIALLLNKETADISIRNKKRGTILSTTGSNNDLSEITLDETRNQVNSQIVLEFYNNREKKRIYNSYEHCLKNKQVSYSGIKNGVRIYYTIGEPDSRTTLPDVITLEAMQKMFPNMNEEQVELFNRFYTLFEPDKIDDETRNMLIGRYPIIKKEAIYVVKKIGVRFKLQLAEILEQVGLTVDELEKEYEKIGYKTTYEILPCFIIPVDYSIEDGTFRVSVDCSQISYNRSLYRLTLIQILPYFGSMNYTSEGYLFLPDGSGIIINGDSNDVNGVKLPIYGYDFNDATLNTDKDVVRRNAVMPVFGIKNGSQTLFAVIEEGAGIATLSAGTSADNTTLNHVAPVFEYLHRESSESKGMVIGASIVRYSKKNYEGNITLRYNLLSDDKADYAGMAEVYRNYLFKGEKPQIKETPFYLTSIGTVNRKERFIGMPVTKERALTDTNQAKQILQALIDKNIDNISFCYHNWICDEYDSKIPTQIKPAKAIGGKNGIEDLYAFTEKHGIDFYPNLQLTYAAKNSFLGSYNSWADGAKPLDGINTAETGFYLSPKNLLKVAYNLKNDLNGYGFKSISIDTIGNDLYSDYTEKDVTLRDDAILWYQKSAGLLAGELSLMTSVGNAYLIPYLSDIIELPLTGSHYTAEYKSVPFAPMVLHGYVNYSGDPLNLETNKRKEFLKSIEYGAGLLFSLNYAKTEMLKHTCYTDLFSINYTDWLEDASEYYHEAKAVYTVTAGAKMLQNIAVQDNVYVTTYDNGTNVYVNYNPEERIVNNIKIPKESFVVTNE